MPINTLYHTWFQRIRELHPRQRTTQIRTFAWLLVGIFQRRSVNLGRRATKPPAHIPHFKNREDSILGLGDQAKLSLAAGQEWNLKQI